MLCHARNVFFVFFFGICARYYFGLVVKKWAEQKIINESRVHFFRALNSSSFNWVLGRSFETKLSCSNHVSNENDGHEADLDMDVAGAASNSINRSFSLFFWCDQFSQIIEARASSSRRWSTTNLRNDAARRWSNSIYTLRPSSSGTGCECVTHFCFLSFSVFSSR